MHERLGSNKIVDKIDFIIRRNEKYTGKMKEFLLKFGYFG